MKRKPGYLLHKSTGQARVRIDGTDHYLGPHGSPESRDRYDELLTAWLVENADGVERLLLQVSDLCLLYNDHAAAYYRKDGKPTSEAACVKHAMRPLIALHGRTRIRDFGPRALKEVRDKMISDGYARKTINAHTGRIRRMFRWGVESEYVPSEVYGSLMAVSGLRAGRSKAVETDPVQPVPETDIKKTLMEVSPIIAAMIRFQLATGARPGETIILRERDIDREGKTWVYIPPSHKTQHDGRQRKIFIGPIAQQFIEPLFSGIPDDYVFRPSESAPRIRKNGRPSKKRVGKYYNRDSYRRAIERACKRLKIEVWTPHQLRHNAATKIRREYGLEAAQVILGHSNARITEVYAERDYELAEGVIQKIG
jgi:integrase